MLLLLIKINKIIYSFHHTKLFKMKKNKIVTIRVFIFISNRKY